MGFATLNIPIVVHQCRFIARFRVICAANNVKMRPRTALYGLIKVDLDLIFSLKVFHFP